MAALVCDLCGGKLVMGAGGIAICESCGVEHSADRMKEKVQEIKGVVRVDNSHMVENYLEMANNALNGKNYAEVETYCNKIIEISPMNYRVWFMKGQASGWQSTLHSPRIEEALTAFVKAFNYAPEDEKDSVAGQAKDELLQLVTAMVSLRADRFERWPDQEEKEGLAKESAAALSTILQFAMQTNTSIEAEQISEPIIDLTTQAAIRAWENTVLPEYKEEKFPDNQDFDKYIERIDYCIELMKVAANQSTETKKNVGRYAYIITLQNAAINGASWKWEYYSPSEYKSVQEMYEDNMKKLGHVVDAKNNRIWKKEYTLTDNAVALRKQDIAVYKEKMRIIEDEKKRIMHEEAQRRFNEYWESHKEEKESMEKERKQILEEIDLLKAEMFRKMHEENLQGEAVREKIHTYNEKKNGLGFFKKAEKRDLENKIEQESKKLQDISAKIAAIKRTTDEKIIPLQTRIEEIDSELTKER